MPETGENLLDAIGRKRGCLRAGGVVDIHKAAEILMNEMRSGKLGRISFEQVEEWREKDRIAAEIAAAEAEAAAAEAALKQSEKQSDKRQR